VLSEGFFGKLHAFNGDFLKRTQRMINAFDNAIKNWNLEDEWAIRQIYRPGAMEYSIQGHLGPDQPFDPLNPFEPPYPFRRRPAPRRPFEVSQNALKEASEPLADVFEDEKAIKIYLQVRGEDAKDIQLNVTKSNVQVKAENLYKMINLPTSNVDLENSSSKCRNGVLEITIPKKEKNPEKDTVKIDIN